MGYIAPLLLAAFVASATAVPTGQRYTCATTCSDSSKFAYEKGMSYEYDYKIRTTTTASPTNFEDQSSMIVNAKATIGVVAPCEYILSLSDVTLDGSSRSSDFGQELAKKPLRFAFNDGRIGNVCSDKQEETWATNFKRGVLSSFQNSMTQLDEEQRVSETDITGECETDYETSPSSDDDTVTIIRTKSSQSCKRLPMSAHTTLPFALQRLPLLSADQKCTQTITAGIMSEVKCDETLVLRPVSGNQGGATTAVETKLVLVNTIPGVASADFEIFETSMEFDSTHTAEKINNMFTTIESLLNELDRKSTPFMQAEVPTLFSQLVENLRQLNLRELTHLYEANKVSRVWRFLVDAAPMVATSASASLVSDLIARQEMTSDEADIWFTSLAFIPNPELEMFTSLPVMLEGRVSKKALLGISAMVNKFCSVHSTCMESGEVRNVVEALEAKLGSACRSTNLSEKEMILTTLKALGNAGRWINGDVIQSCFSEETNPAEVRVAALEAWRKAPCDYDRSALLQTYTDSRQDPEMRIGAYLSLMACPTVELIDNIKNRLSAESVNQVGTFVWTHLSNLQESASHEKQWIRELIGEDMLVNKFNSSALKFSRNFESSFYMEELGFGSTIDSNVIFSSKSFLPRSGMLNITLDLFGESINMLEVGGRFEGFESFAEKFFGPNGYYPEETVEGILKSLRQGKTGQETTIEEMLDVVTDQPEGSYYMRVMGNDMQYHHFRGIENFFESKPDFNLMQVLTDFAKNGETDYSKTYKFIDTEISYPTIAGLPLTLKLNSTATIGLRMDGKFSAQSFSDIDISGHIYPSAAMEIDATMLIDAHFSKSGIKVSTNAHTSFFLDGNVKLQQGKIVDIALNMPQEKVELVNVKSEKVFIENDIANTNAETDAMNNNEMCTGGSTMFGVELCTSATFDANVQQASVYLSKRDTQTAYKLRYLQEPHGISFLIDTPDSVTDRKLSFVFSKAVDQLKFDVHTPWTTLQATGALVSSDNIKKIELEVVADGSRTYQVTLGHTTTRTGTTMKIAPSLTIRTPDRVIFDASGSVMTDSADRTIQIDLSNQGIFPVSLKFSGTCANNMNKMDFDINSSLLTMTASGLIDNNDQIHSQLDVKYSFDKQPNHSMKYFLQLQHLVSDEERTVSGAVILQSSMFSCVNVNAKARCSIASGKIESSSSFNLGQDLFNLDTENIIAYSFEEKSKKYNIRSTVKSSSHSLDMLLTENFELRRNYLLREAHLRITPDHVFDSKTEMAYSNVDGYVRVHVKSFPNFDLTQEMSYTKIAQKHYTAQITGKYNILQWNFDGSFQDKSIEGERVDMQLAANSAMNGSSGKLSLQIKADQQSVNVEAKTKFNDMEEKFAKLQATLTKIQFDANIITPVNLRAEINLTGATRTLEATGSIAGKDLKITGSFMANSVAGLFKIGDFERSFKGEIFEKEVVIEVNIETNKSIIGRITHDFTNGVTISASVETPFTGYEKQEVMFAFKKQNNEFTSQANVTWRNSQLMAFTTTANYESSASASAMNVNMKMTCNDSIFGFENFNFAATHQIQALNGNSSLSGSLDGEEVLNCSLKMTKEGPETNVDLSLITPFTETLSIKVNRVRMLHSKAVIMYGNRSFVAEFKKTVADNELVIELSAVSEQLVDINSKFTYKNETNNKIIELQGNYNEQKFIATINSEIELTSDGRIYNGNGRIILPRMAPITATWTSSIKNNKQFITEFEMTRFWTNYGTIKMHTNFNIESIKNIQLAASVISPVMRVSVDSIFKYEDNNVDAYIKGSYNEMRSSITTNGFVDIANTKAKLRMTVTYQDNIILKGSVDHEFKQGTRVTNLKFKQGSVNYNIVHQFTYDNKMNWVNKLEINDIILHNQMISEQDNYRHAFDWTMADNYIRGEGSLSADLLTINKSLNTVVKLYSSFTHDLKTIVKFESNGQVYKPEITIQYGPDYSMTLKSVCTCLPEECSLTLDLETSVMEKIGFEGVYKMASPKALKVTFSNGQHVTTIDLSGSCNVDEKLVSIEVSSTHLSYPVKIEGEMTDSSEGMTIELTLNHKDTYEGKLILPKLSKMGKVFLEVKTPFVHLREGSMSVEYDIRQLPASLKVELTRNNQKYIISGKLNNTAVEILADLNGSINKFETSWNLTSQSGTMSASISSECFDLKDIETNLSYDLNEKSVELTTTNNSERVATINAELGNNKGKLESKIAFKGIHEMKLSFDESSFSAQLNKNNEEIIMFSGQHNLNASKGEIEVVFKSIIRDFEHVSSSFKYSFTDDKFLDFLVTSGDKQISLKSTIDIGDKLAPRVSIDISTFLDQFKTISGTASYDIRSSAKKCEVSLRLNTEQLTWALESTEEYPGKGVASLNVVSPLSNLNLNLDYFFRSGLYDAKVAFDLNNEHHEYDVKFSVSHTAVEGTIISPTSSWKQMQVSGQFESTNLKRGGSMTITINNEIIKAAGELVTDSNTAQLKMALNTPYENYKNIELDLISKLSTNEKSFKALLKKQEDIFSFNVTSLQQYKKGEIVLEVHTPITRFSSMIFQTKYNFSGDVKAAELNYELNGKKEHMSAEMQVNNNNVQVVIESPFQNFKKIVINGDMTLMNGKRSLIASFQNNEDIYSLEGELNLSEQSFNLRSTSPTELFSSLEISGTQTQTGYILSFTKDGDVSNIIIDYKFEEQSSFIKLRTPFTGYNNVHFEYQFEKTQNTLSASFNFEKDDIKFTLGSDVKLSNLKSSIVVTAEVPIIDGVLSFNADYDVSSDSKTAQIITKYNEIEHKFTMALTYDTNSAAVKFAVPFINEEFGIEYEYNVDQSYKSMNGLIIASRNSDIYRFNAKAVINSDNMEVTMNTPFKQFEVIQAKAQIDLSDKLVQGNMIFGSYESAIKVQYQLTDLLLEIITPFEILQNFKMASKTSFLGPDKWYMASAVYNSQVYGFTVKYQPHITEKRALMEVIYDSQKYSITFGGEFDENKIHFISHMQAPCEDFSDATFSATVDTANEDKAIEIYLRNGEDVKIISLNGKFVGDLVDIRFRSPFSGWNEFRTYGSLNRSRRSAEFSVMSDSSSSSIRASFNSLSIKLTSPYAAVRESSLFVERTDAGEFKLNYKRGDNFVDIAATPTGKRRSFDVTINSAIPGWEFLAVAGRLDRDELIGYLSGQINEAKMTVQGGGKYSRLESDLKFDVTTPYVGYESVSLVLAFNMRRKDLNLDVRSPSSNFHITIKTKPNFTIDVFVPHSLEPTVISGSLTVFNGNLSITSRFTGVRTFKLEYNASLRRDEVHVTSKIEHNGVELFNLMFDRGGGKAHLMIHARRGVHHSILHFERVGFETIEFSYTRDGSEFKVEAQGTGNLPEKGSLDLVINNSFREIPRTVSGHIEIDRSASPKHVKLELTFPGSKLYVVDMKYNINLRRPQEGDYQVSITTPDKRARVWNNIAGSWNLKDHDDVTIEFDMGRLKYILRGKLGLRESNFVITSSQGNVDDIICEWRFIKSSTPSEINRDYYFKIGTAARFVMSKLKGRFSGLTSGEAEYAVQFSRYMENPFELTANWKRDSSGLSGDGTFIYGQYNGNFVLKKLKREASTRSLVLSWEATTNVPEFNKITVEGEYNFNHQAVVKLDIVWDTSKISINFNIHDITSNFTEQTASFSLPSIGDVDVTFGHDFRNKKKRTFTMIGKLMGQESHLKAEWNRNKDFTKLTGNVDVQSILLGHITLIADYDIRNIHDAKADIKYTRNDNKFFNLNWVRKFTANELTGEVTFESSNRLVPTAKISIHANFRNGFNLDAILQAGTKEVKVSVEVKANSITGEINSPIPGYEHITGSFVYDTSDRKKKTATLRYQRGDRSVNMDINLELASKKTGSLHVSLETPFEFVRTLTLDASWKNRRGEVHYKRNDIAYSFTGQAEVKTDRSSFELTFTPSSNDPIKVSFNFNAGSLLSGRGTQPEEIAELELEMLGKRVAFEVKGFRNSERINLDIKAESSLEKLREFELKLDSELNTQQREGLFEIKINDFHFKVKNHFERRANNGYYWRSEFDSTLTSMPGLIIGIGKENEARILTVGVGEDREITASFTPKDHFASGFSGKLSLPRRGIIDAAYDVNYHFNGPDVLEMDVHLELEPGKLIEADIVYNSDGVQARLSSPLTGRRSARMRRSLTESGFYAEVGLDDYNMSIRGDALNTDMKRGFVVEGEVFGRKVSVDTLFQRNGMKYIEGKFLIKTTFSDYESLGGLFTLSNMDGKIIGRSEINLPSYITPKMHMRVELDTNDKLKGMVFLDISGQEYYVDADLTGNMHSGYEGQLKIVTPFHAASEIILDGKFKIQSARNVDLSFLTKYPTGSLNIMLKYNISPNEVLAETRIQCSTSDKDMHAKVMYKIENDAAKATLSINQNELALEIMRLQMSMKLNANFTSPSLESPIVFTISGEKQSSNKFIAGLTVTYSGETHTTNMNLNLVKKDFNVSFMASSPIVNGRHMISLEHSIPESYKTDSFNVMVAYSGAATYDINFKVERTNGVNAIISLSSATGVYEIGCNLTKNQSQVDAILSFKMPGAEHKLTSSIFSDIDTSVRAGPPYNGKIHFDLELMSPLLPGDITYSMKIESGEEKKMSEQTLIIGDSKQSVISGYSYSPNGVILVFDIDTTLFSIGQASMKADLRTKKLTRAIITTVFSGKTHSFDLRLNSEEHSLMCVLKSPLVPGNIIKAEISYEGRPTQKWDFNTSLKYDRKTFSSDLKWNFISIDDISSELEIKTPFKGYRKMNFGAQFENNGIIKAKFFAEQPIGLNFDLVSGKNSDGYHTAIEIETPIIGYEVISVKVDVPLTRTAASVFFKLPTHEYGLDFEVESQEFTKQVSGNLNLNGMTYGAGFGLRNKAPYEVSYFYKVHKIMERFHIMMDSSVFSVLSLFL